jgi:hypothetical protein
MHRIVLRGVFAKNRWQSAWRGHRRNHRCRRQNGQRRRRRCRSFTGSGKRPIALICWPNMEIASAGWSATALAQAGRPWTSAASILSKRRGLRRPERTAPATRHQYRSIFGLLTSHSLTMLATGRPHLATPGQPSTKSSWWRPTLPCSLCPQRCKKLPISVRLNDVRPKPSKCVAFAIRKISSIAVDSQRAERVPQGKLKQIEPRSKRTTNRSSPPPARKSRTSTGQACA